MAQQSPLTDPLYADFARLAWRRSRRRAVPGVVSRSLRTWVPPGGAAPAPVGRVTCGRHRPVFTRVTRSDWCTVSSTTVGRGWLRRWRTSCGRPPADSRPGHLRLWFPFPLRRRAFGSEASTRPNCWPGSCHAAPAGRSGVSWTGVTEDPPLRASDGNRGPGGRRRLSGWSAARIAPARTGFRRFWWTT